MRTSLLATMLTLGTAAAGASAQEAPPAPPAVAVPPVNIVLPNYETMPIGETAGLQAGAFVARANDSSAVFYNPAGLARAERTAVSGAAGMYQFNFVSPENLERSGSSFRQVPAMFSVVLHDLLGRDDLAGGLSFARVNAWAQSVMAERTLDAGAQGGRLSYNSSSMLDSWLVNLGIGYDGGDRWRAGVSIDGQLTTIEQSQAIADQLRSATGLDAAAINALNAGWATHLRLTLGGQYEVTPTVLLGAVVRTAGLSLLKQASASLEGIADAGRATTTASFFDEDMQWEWRVPLEFRIGAAYVTPRAQAEVNLIVHDGAGRYDAWDSSNAVMVVNDAGSGAPPVVTNFDYLPPVIDSRSVVNVAVGGHYVLTQGGAWTVHAGYATDKSPVGPEDTAFTKVNLQKVTVGLTGQTKLFLGSLGLQYVSGTSGTFTLRTLPDGTPIQTKFDVSNLGLIYSLTLMF